MSIHNRRLGRWCMYCPKFTIMTRAEFQACPYKYYECVCCRMVARLKGETP